MTRITPFGATLVAGAALISAAITVAAAAGSIGAPRVSTQAAPTAAAAPAATRIALTAAGSALVERGLAKAAPADLAGFEEVPAPALRFRIDNARATRAPWVDSNAWRF